jgi:hypothetical protein
VKKHHISTSCCIAGARCRPQNLDNLRVIPVKFRPLHDRVVIRRVEQEAKTTGGAVSVAGLLVTTEAMVAEVPVKNAQQATPSGGDMGF